MAVDMFLKLDGIKGESKDHKHAEEIHIESFSWGLSQTGAHSGGGGGGAGKVSVHDISVTKFVGKAGEKPLEYMKIKLVDILISGVQFAGHGGDQLSENLTLNFAKFQVEYMEQKADGTGVAGGQMGWDVKKNEKV